MVKFYCDRCGKEVEKLKKIRVMTQKLPFGSFETEEMSICKDCDKEHNEILDILTDMRLLLTEKFLKERD